jgi:hypothetical protein
MNAMLQKLDRPGRGSGPQLGHPDHELDIPASKGGGDPGDPEIHPIQGIIEEVVQSFLDGKLTKDAALKRLAGALDLYEHEADGAETESARNEWRGREPMPQVDAKKAEAKWHGDRLRLDTSTGKRVLESSAPSARYNPQQAQDEWHGRG